MTGCCLSSNRRYGLGLLVALGVAAAALAQSGGGLVKRYVLIELESDSGGESRAYSVNDTGQIIGYVDIEGTKHSAHWHNRVMTDLHGTVHFDLQHPLFDVGYSESFAISNGGQVVGTARTTIECPPTFTITNAFILRPSVLTDLATPYPGDSLANLMTLGNPCLTAYDSAATGISNANHVVGWADREDGVTHAFLVTPGNGQFYADVDADVVNDYMVDLGTLAASDPVSSASDVNDAGKVTGYSYTTTGNGTAGYHAFLLTPLDGDLDGTPDTWFVDGGDGVNTLMLDLGTLGGTNSWGRAINNNDQVVGESDMDTGAGEHYTRAFRWRNGIMTDLGTLRDDPTEGFSAASGVNDAGVVVGWAENEDRERRAFIYENGTMQDLNEVLYLVTETGSVIIPELTLTEARDINEDGLIVGWGTVRGGSTLCGFLLTPTMVDPDTLPDTTTISTTTAGTTNTTNYSSETDFGTSGSGTTGTSGGQTTGSSTTAAPTSIGLCGAGSLAVLPLTLLGWCWLKTSQRRGV